MTTLRTPKGTIDYGPKESKIYEQMISTVTKIFKKHGACSIETPTFELKQILTNKYGDDSKLIFDLKDQGGDICALRYDLTVPFARYMAQNNIQKIKRYQIGKVFRRDQPAITKGRFREFIQCDFDIAGKYLPMTTDAECLKIAYECLSSFEFGMFTIKINNRKILGAILTLSGLNKELHNTVCSTIDKLDKLSIEEIRKELVSKGCDNKGIEIIEKYVKYKGGVKMLEELKNDPIYEIEEGKTGIDELLQLNDYLQIFKINNISYELNLARGTDYYTGIIFEAVFKDYSVGAVLGGGRYDNLVNDFIIENGGKGIEVPCIGFSVGVARIYAILSEKMKEIKESEVMVFVGASGGSFLEERMYILNELWNANISAETLYIGNMNFRKQATFCSKNKIPFFLIIGEEEIKNNYVQLCDENNERVSISRDEMIEVITKKIQNLVK